ncbi:hypothetical protein [Dysgonomonas sp. 25]|uniref:hypothetical protein n=1 Tax=Dysgonomonas sp. 25 TaxID=2302933 RepID=UPI0013D18D39|nr:hypothetical protein [Dysgonomonas sp. 25]NDV69996.1 hypothetical protein [Dysgonomonas sp. 25]
MSETYKNKQAIKDRIWHFAAGYYGLGQTDTIDPVSNLFLESLCEEIYRLSGEIERMEDRILDKLSSTLVSDIEHTSFPSHTILHASPSQSSFPITTRMPFYSDRTYDGKRRRLSFYPVCNTSIYQGDIKYFVYKGQFYSIEAYGTKKLLARSKSKSSFPDNTFWFGMELDHTITNLEGLSFYLNLSATQGKDTFLREFVQADWKIKGQELQLQRGISVMENIHENKVLEFYSSFDNSNRINRKIKTLYDPHYLSINNNFPVTDKTEILPDYLKEKFDDTLYENIPKPLLWISVNCPASLPVDIIESLQISINTFPVTCKELINQTCEVNEVFPVIPLRTGANESFLSICSLTDSLGHQYYDIPIEESENSIFHLYSLRHGGFERFNSRDAGEFLFNAIHKLSGESSSFFRNRKDIKSDLKQVRLKMGKVLRNLKETARNINGNYNIENYILVDQNSEQEIYFLEYWIINYEIANGMRAGAVFYSDSDNTVLPGSIYSLLPVTKGHSSSIADIKTAQYKKSLTKSSLIVTESDIISFCKKELPEAIKGIEIKNGYEENPDKTNDFLQTTDVYIQITDSHLESISADERQFLKELLQAHSPATFRYRIFII